jgi:hypothetical protein
MSVALGGGLDRHPLPTVPMLRSKIVRSFVALTGAFLLASCSDSILQSPTAPSDVAASHSGPGGGQITSAISDVTNLELRAVWWRKNQKGNVRVSKTIDPSGGVISLPETGLRMEFPAGAVEKPITITVSADDKYVAYKMEPSGTQFLKDVTVTQSLGTTELSGRPLRDQLFAAYIADDRLKLSGKVPVLEIEPSKTIFSPITGLPEAHVWIIRHFSRYMLASG